MRPADNQENMDKCTCGSCPMHNDCNKEKMEGLFCAKGVSNGCDMDESKGCICGDCSVFSENSLSVGFFCTKPMTE